MTERTNPISKIQAPRRVEYLDAVRGIAALMVVVYHFIGWRWGDYTRFHAASLVFNGSDAVSFFFVLSGMVLSYKYFHHGAEIQLKRYTLKRIWRLYPAFIATILINYLYWNRGQILDGDILPVLKDMFWTNGQGLWQELTMVRHAHKFYVPGWTMGVEMAISLLMPIFIIVGRYKIQFIWWMLLVSLFMGNYINMFTFHFLLGTLISFYFIEIQQYDWKASKWYKFRWLIAIVVFLLFSVRHIDRMFPFPEQYKIAAQIIKIDFFHYTGLASAIILLWVIRTAWIQKILTKAPLLFLGKISYSVYLMHWFVVIAIMNHWDKLIVLFPSFNIGFASLLFGLLAATLLLATLLYNLVELPFMKWSNRLFNKK